MRNIGFTYYNEPVVEQPPTTQEILDSLTAAQKVAVLNGFTNKVLPNRLKYQIPIPEVAIRRLYEALNNIEETAKAIMREEVVLQEGTYDEQGNEITPPEYNVAPTTPQELLADVALNSSNVFTQAQVEAILTKMVQYSKADGTGDWAFYSTEVVK